MVGIKKAAKEFSDGCEKDGGGRYFFFLQEFVRKLQTLMMRVGQNKTKSSEMNMPRVHAHSSFR